MKHLQKTSVLLAMVFMVSCDENMMGDRDASIPESCILYVAPGAEVDGGDGASETTPLSSVEGVMSKTAALKSECKDAAEVRFAEGALTEEQYKVVREGLNSAGIRMGKYESKKESEGAATGAADFRSFADLEIDRLKTPTTIIDRFPGIADGPSAQDMTSRLYGSCTDYYVVTGKNPYYKLDSNVSTEVDWVFATNSGNLAIRRSATAGSGSTGERIGFRSSLTPRSAIDMSGYENDGSADKSGILRLYNGTTTSTPLVMDNNEIDSYENIGLYLNNNSKKQVAAVGPSAAWSGTSTSAPTGVLEISNASYLDKFSNGSRNYLLIGNGQIDAYNRNKTSSTALAYSKKDLALQSLSGGRVLIGKMTDTTNAKLIVGGTIKASELLIDTVTGADFVFEDEYDLMSLEDVESFVRENKHLPEVASAEEMKKEGVPMAELQIKLLQKIEELTLYAIEQEKRIAALEKGCVTK